MRIDLILKYLCVVKSRSLAKGLCERGRVLVDGTAARPAARLEAGRRVTIQFSKRTFTFELLRVPQKQLSKSAAVDYYRPVETPPTDARPGETDDWLG